MVNLRAHLIKIGLLCNLALAILTGVASAQSLSGVVTNRTNNKPAAGDDVVLLKLAQGMQELARAKTDARGRFTLQIPEGGLHLIRVTHDKANYFHPVPPNTKTVEVDVYSAAPQLEGVTLAEDVVQLQTDASGGSLRVVEHFLVKNDSVPAMTLFNEHPFEFFLPQGATVDGASAKAPGGMGVETPVVPTGEANRYTMIFPIRPGETEFNVWYKLAYTGSFQFQPRLLMQAGALGIMMPASMSFKASGSSYKTVTEELPGKAQAYVITNAAPSQPLGFTVSGKGELPRDGGAAAQGSQSGATAGTTQGAVTSGQPGTDTRPGGGIGVPVDKDAERDPWTKYRGWIIGAMGLVLVTAAGIMLSRPVAGPVVPAGAGRTAPLHPTGSALQALKEEMFAAETDRIAGRLSEKQYAELRSAFDIVLKRAMAREGQLLAARPVIPE